MDVPDRLAVSQSSELFNTQPTIGSPIKPITSQVDLFDPAYVPNHLVLPVDLPAPDITFAVPDLTSSVPPLQTVEGAVALDVTEGEGVSVIDQLMESCTNVPGRSEDVHDEEEEDVLNTTLCHSPTTPHKAFNTTICLSPATPKAISPVRTQSPTTLKATMNTTICFSPGTSEPSLNTEICFSPNMARPPPTFCISPLLNPTPEPEPLLTTQGFLSNKDLITPDNLLSTQAFFDSKPVKKKRTPPALPSTQVFFDSKERRKRGPEPSLQHPALRRCLFSPKDAETKKVEEFSMINLSIEEGLESAEEALESIEVLKSDKTKREEKMREEEMLRQDMVVEVSDTKPEVEIKEIVVPRVSPLSELMEEVVQSNPETTVTAVAACNNSEVKSAASRQCHQVMEVEVETTQTPAKSPCVTPTLTESSKGKLPLKFSFSTSPSPFAEKTPFKSPFSLIPPLDRAVEKKLKNNREELRRKKEEEQREEVMQIERVLEETRAIFNTTEPQVTPKQEKDQGKRSNVLQPEHVSREVDSYMTPTRSVRSEGAVRSEGTVRSTTFCTVHETTDQTEDDELVNSPELVRKMFSQTKVPSHYPAYPPHITKVVPIPLPVSVRRARTGLTRRSARIPLHPYIRTSLEVKREE